MIVNPILNKAQMTEEGIKRYLDADLDNPELRDELLDYFVDKMYIDDDWKLSFVLKLFDKDEVELQEVSEDEIFDFVGVEVFDNFVTCSTNNPDTLNGCPDLFMRVRRVRIPTGDNAKHGGGVRHPAAKIIVFLE